MEDDSSKRSIVRNLVEKGVISVAAVDLDEIDEETAPVTITCTDDDDDDAQDDTTKTTSTAVVVGGPAAEVGVYARFHICGSSLVHEVSGGGLDRTSTHGAYAVPGPSDDMITAAGDDDDVDIVSAVDDDDIQQSDLPSALLVVQEDLEVAQEVVSGSGSTTTNGRSNDGNNKGKRITIGLFLLCCCCCLVSLVVIIVVVVLPAASDAKPPSTNNGTVYEKKLVIDGLPSYTRRAIAGKDPQSPQFKAYAWLKQDPYFNNYSNDRLIQRFALATLFYATDGPNWTSNKHWLDYEKSECRWWNLARLPPLNVETCLLLDDDGTTDNNFLLALALKGNGMRGSIPRQVGLLSTLGALVLGDQEDLVGSVPLEVWQLPSLVALSLFRNQLTGTLPSRGLVSAGSQERNMTYLDLSSNHFTGTIPSEIGLLRKVSAFSLGDNALSGTLPVEMGDMTSLEDFSIHGNALTGTIHPGFFQHWGNMFAMVIRNTLLTGALPSEIGLLSNTLRLIYDYENLLEGPIPSQLGLLTSLEKLYLTANLLSGSFPSDLCRLSGLNTVNLAGNWITGPIPSECRRLSSLREFTVHSNEMTGSIPSTVGLWTDLESFLVNDNYFDGSVPQELWQISSLKRVAIGRNLTGSIPKVLPDLVWLELRSPHLSGTIPSNVCTNPDLMFLELNCSTTLCGCDCPCN